MGTTFPLGCAGPGREASASRRRVCSRSGCWARARITTSPALCLSVPCVRAHTHARTRMCIGTVRVQSNHGVRGCHPTRPGFGWVYPAHPQACPFSGTHRTHPELPCSRVEFPIGKGRRLKPATGRRAHGQSPGEAQATPSCPPQVVRAWPCPGSQV